MEDKLLLRIDEAAKLIGLSRSQVYAMIADGTIPVKRIGAKTVRIPAEGLRKWANEQEAANG